jgi:DNA-binding CsgD family transcriptional regulator
MECFVSPDADAAVRRLTSDFYRLEFDAGGVYLRSAATGDRARLAHPLADRPTDPDGRLSQIRSSLSEREKQVMTLLGDGLDMDQIASQLGLSVKTIETFRSRIKRKLAIKNRSGLLALAVEWAIHERRTLQTAAPPPAEAVHYPNTGVV